MNKIVSQVKSLEYGNWKGSVTAHVFAGHNSLRQGAYHEALGHFDKVLFMEYGILDYLCRFLGSIHGDFHDSKFYHLPHHIFTIFKKVFQKIMTK